jgi:hypothetical protein
MHGATSELQINTASARITYRTRHRDRDALRARHRDRDALKSFQITLQIRVCALGSMSGTSVWPILLPEHRGTQVFQKSRSHHQIPTATTAK